MSKPVFLVCGTARASNAEQASCSKCKVTIWPTTGSAQQAEDQKLSMICMDCYEKMDDTVFGGFMDHGRMLPEALSERLFLEYLRVVALEKICPPGRAQN